MHYTKWYHESMVERKGLMDIGYEVKDYEMALSYAHNDKKVAEVLKEELENLFADRFFMDEYKPEELANASLFKEQLRNIFQRTNYSIILYSTNYIHGIFTHIECGAILNKEKNESNSNPHFFIINLDVKDDEICERLQGYKYISLKGFDVSKDDTKFDKRKLREQIHDIVHNHIKKNMINQTIQERKRQNEYFLNIQTKFVSGNSSLWKMDYDWNLLAAAYIGEDGSRIKEGEKKLEWKDLWEYVQEEFILIKNKLQQEPDTKLTLHLNCHLSIAYKLGQVYGDLWQASGNRNLVLVSSNRVADTKFALEKKINYIYPEEFCKRYEGNSSESHDIVCIISIKAYEQSNVLETVKQFMEKSGQKYGKICLFQKEMIIDDVNVLEGMGKYLREKMKCYRTGSDCIIHLFADTMVPLMFVLGAKSIFPGKVQLYEYIREEDSYEKSLVG